MAREIDVVAIVVLCVSKSEEGYNKVSKARLDRLICQEEQTWCGHILATSISFKRRALYKVI